MVADDIYFCRHGQTEYNAQDRLQGRREVPLNALGRSQARRNGVYLRRRLGERAETFTFIASPMDRAQETMRIIRTELRLDPEDYRTDDRLVEVGYGDWEGSTIPEVAARDPDAVAAREADKWNYRCPGTNSESYAELLLRIEPLLASLTPQTIIVSHGGVGRAVLCGVGGISETDAAMTIVPQDRILTFDRTGPHWV
ncbi:histidine phosphatase family protein [Fulvimarina sp. 2208YS6-2-32]|uniref:Histidine phosphatase family protein n=1 Tax=Fulvimarina uroteuthidis TaxID=3098149 RepID=A0ABU5I158_9HYPH|nr:histidine phosphatase family protein [Fulvimarina sp. 2208YS6-2-32]MDY8108549.1 histidine phosphatase family protein [Fulvimarina sp. 2208YS6-2-32]